MRNQVFKKLFSALLALIMVAGLLPASVLAEGWGEIAPNAETTPAATAEPTAEPTTEPAETTEPADEPVETAEPTAEPAEGEEPAEPVQEETNLLLTNMEAVSSTIDKENYYRIVHLDCGRKYFSVDYIKGVIDAMYLNGFNQLELAFGNGGLRFVLDNMDLTDDKGNTLFYSDKVKSAITQGNKAFYDDPNGNALTESDMKEIIKYAQGKGIEIVPLLNMPGHMDGILKSDLFSQYKLSGSKGSLDLNNPSAVAFGKALLKLYVDWFNKNSNTKYFNFGADEYGQGIQNPYIDTDKASVTYGTLISYMNDCAKIIEGAGMTARCFNDFVCYNKRNDCNLYKTVQVCYWSNQWNNSEYNTVTAIKNAGYKLINTNQKWYFVPSKAKEYGKDTVLSNFQTFDVTKFQNIINGYNIDSTTYIQINDESNVGAMFCVWCDEPSTGVELTDVKDLITAMADANPTFFTKKTIKNTTVGDTNKNTTTDDADTVRVNGPELAKLACNKVEDTACIAINAVNGRIAAYNIIPSTADAEYKETAEVRIKIPDGWDKTKVKAFIVENDGTAKSIDGTATEDGWYVFTAPHFSVMGIYEQAVTYEDGGEITIPVGETGTLTIKGVVADIGEIFDSSIATKLRQQTVSGGEYTKEITSEADLKDSAKYLIQSSRQGGTLTSTPSTQGSATGLKLNGIVSVDNANVWTITYNNGTATIKDSSGGYLTIGNNSASVSNKSADLILTSNVTGKGTNYTGWTISQNDYYLNHFEGGNSTTAAGWTDSTASTDSGSIWQIYEIAERPASTEITFEGKKVGETSIVIDGKIYTIKVVDKELTDNYIYVNYFITNQRVDGNDGVQSKKVLAAEVNTEEGKALSEIAAQTGTYTSGNVSKNVKYYKSELQFAVNIQTHEGWTNKIGQGTVAEKLRYWDNKWSVYNGKEWEAIDTTYSTTTDPETYAGKEAAVSTGIAAITAYYLLQTDVTKEIITYATDWGEDLEKGQDFSEYSLLDFAVVYKSDNKRSPDSFANSKTLVYNNNAQKDYKWSGGGDYARYIKDIYAENTSNYEVYMITVTENSGQFSYDSSQSISSSTTITYPAANEKVAWALSEDDFARSGLEKYTDYKEGGEPIVSQIYAKYRRAYLVTYYVRLKETVESKLTVNYYVEGASDPFYTYHIGVKADTKFDEGFARTVNPVGLTKNTVENSLDVTETVQWELEKMPEIGAQYRYSDYTFTRVELDKTDYKTVNLYYTFKYEKTFVVDYGLPIKITPGDVNNHLSGDDVTITNVEVTGKSDNALITVDGNHAITYQLNDMLIDGYDTFGVRYSGTLKVTDAKGNETVQANTTAKYTVTIIPATTVYYEDSFATFYGADKAEQKEFEASSGSDKAGVWYIDGKTATVDQALEALGDKKNVYGYDDAYKDSTMFSMGSARKVTVNKNGKYAQAKFTFKGTGFDVISLTNNNSGAITVEVFDKDGKTAKTTAGEDVFYLVNNYYGYTYDKDTGWTASPDTTQNAIYQVPVIKVKDLAYGEYTAVITVDYASFFDKTGDSQYSFWLDAVRVYNPAGNTLDTEYGKDDEAKPVYTEVRKALIGQGSFDSNDATNVTGAVFIDGKATGATIEDYTNYGPNHEVYLAQGQAIAFKIVADSEPKTVQLGVKLANGESGTLNIGGDGIKFAAYNNKEAANSLTLTTATDMYYALTGLTWSDGEESEAGKKVSNLIVLTNDSANIISITNVKCTFEAAQEAETNTVALAISYDDALMAVSMVNNLLAPEPEPEPEKTFEPERFEASWTKNVMQGRKATLTVKTSEDVEAITVDGQTVSSYRTRTERVGFGRRAKRITYREFTYSMVAQETADFSITAINAEGTESEAITARMTVQKRPSSVRDVWNWFKGWF